MRTFTTAGAALAVATALLVPLPAKAAPGPGGGDARTVTLVTGDRVTVTDDLTAMIQRGAGREEITFSTDDSGGRLRVVPSDAVPLLRAGRLDPRLFDVTTLLKHGYGDPHGALPLIVTGDSQPRTLRGATRTRALAAVNGYAVRQERAHATGFWRDVIAGDGKIWLDGRASLSLDASVKQIGAPAAWAHGLTGAGVKVAVLDTGIDATHPDLAGKVAARADFTETPDERDLIGHGTHVASTIAGQGTASEGRYQGVAPGVTLLDGRVCESRFCSESAILAGMQWAAEQGAQVVNMSLGGPDEPGTDPLETAVQTLTERYGTLFVAAAGNQGLDHGVSSPSSADAALAVGAVTKADEHAAFSNRGPRAGDGGLKPDITAPGVDITAARSKDSPGDGSYQAMSGTSMATPHVVGVAALLAGARPDWKAGTLKAALMASAKANPELGVFTQGAGRVDADRATTQSVTADPPGLGYGLQTWPHDDDQPIARKLTYHNHHDRPVTLTLESRAGRTFTVTPATLTVPAGGQAEAIVTADTRIDGPDGLLGGHVVATGPDGLSVSTPVGVEKEVESYELTVNHTDRSGAPTGRYEMSIRSLDTEQSSITVFGEQNPFTIRLPKGRWQVDTTVVSEDGVTLLVQPELMLDQPRTVEADARLGRPMSVTLPAADAVLLQGEVVYQWRSADGHLYNRGWLPRRLDRSFTAQLGPDRTYEGFRTKVGGHWAGAETYRLAWFVDGRLPTGFHRDVVKENLAMIRTDYARHLPDAEAAASGAAAPREGQFRAWLSMDDFTTPSVRTEYVNTDDGIRWRRFLLEYGTDGRLNQFQSGYTRYPAGKVTTERWNRGVFGPSLQDSEEDTDAAARTGEVISTNLWMFGDGRGSLGYSSRATAHVALHRDGELVGEADSLTADLTVPPGEAAYKLVARAERGAPASLSTSVSATWTFRSATTAKTTRLPLSVIRFSPELNVDNTAPAGRRFTIPVSVRPMPDSTAGKPRGLTVEVSYDDGATWARARVQDGKVVLGHPAGQGFVSLRAKSTDTAGNTVEQTVLRAYRIA
ncbi:S8 family serine peptidase [Nonomuraea cavernae]|uniref:S8 family serine peptidase n=1 Tax=Nonomuraea cavernae TaxID=2045107 RepID=UPI0033DCA8C3